MSRVGRHVESLTKTKILRALIIESSMFLNESAQRLLVNMVGLYPNDRKSIEKLLMLIDNPNKETTNNYHCLKVLAHALDEKYSELWVYLLTSDDSRNLFSDIIEDRKDITRDEMEKLIRETIKKRKITIYFNVRDYANSIKFKSRELIKEETLSKERQIWIQSYRNS